jgi:hypothetical protein
MNTKLELLNCNANIYFDRTCLEQNIIPKYTRIKMNWDNISTVKHTESRVQNTHKEGNNVLVYQRTKLKQSPLHLTPSTCEQMG